MGKKSTERRVYTKEFKAEAVALAEKREKPISQIAKDLGINDGVLYRWIHHTREAAGGGLQAFPGHGRPRDAELARLRKEVKSLREANEILKKRRSSSHKKNPNNGVLVHENKAGPICHQGDGRTFWGKPQRLLPMGKNRSITTAKNN